MNARARWSGRFAALALGLTTAIAMGRVRADGPAAETVTFADSARVVTRATGSDAPGPDAVAPLVLALAFSPDGRSLAVAGEDPVVEVRDATTNRVRVRLSGHTEPVVALAYSPDGKVIATGGFDQAVRLWDAATGSERAALPVGEGWVLALAFAPDGKTLAAAGQGGGVRLIEASTGRVVATLAGHDGPVRALAFAPDGTLLASGGADRVVRLWDVPARNAAGTLVGHQGMVRGLAFVDGGKTLVTTGEDHAVKVWDVAAQSLRSTRAAAPEAVTALAASPRGTGFVAGAYDGRFRVFDLGSDKPLDTHAAHGEGITALAFNPATGAIVTAGYDRAVKLWSPNRPLGKLLKGFDPPAKALRAVALAPDGKTVAVADVSSPGVWLLDAATGADRGKLEGARAAGTLEFDPTGRLLVTQAFATDLLIWDVRRLTVHGRLASAETPTVPANVRNSRRRSLTSALAPDGRRLAVGGEDGSIGLYAVPPPEETTDGPAADAESKALKPLRRLRAPADEGLQAVAFSPDGTRVAASLLDQRGGKTKVVLLDVADGRERAAVAVAGGKIVRLAFAPDGKTLAGAVLPSNTPGAVTAVNGTLLLWSTTDLAETGRAGLPKGNAATLTYAPDGSRLAMGTGDGTVQFWDAVTRAPSGVLKAHTGIVSALSFSGDGRTLATVTLNPGNDAPLKLWDVGPDSSVFPWSHAAVLEARFSPDGKVLALACDDGVVRLADPTTRQVVRELKGHKWRVWTVAFSPDGTTIASGSGNWQEHDDSGEIRLWDAATGALKAQSDGALPLVFSLAVAPDGKTLSSGGWGNSVRLWGVGESTLTPAGTLDGHTGSVRRLAYSPDGRRLATASFDGTVRLWDAPVTRGASPVRTIEAHKSGVNGMAFAPDGKTLATGGKGGPIGASGVGDVAVWDVATGDLKGRSTTVLQGQLLCLAFAPDGKTLATGGGDFDTFAELRLWDAASLSPRSELAGHAIWVEGVTFAPDGKSLVSVGGVSGKPGEVRVWALDKK